MMEFADRIPIVYSRYERRSLLGVFQSAARPLCYQRLLTLANSRVAVNLPSGAGHRPVRNAVSASTFAKCSAVALERGPWRCRSRIRRSTNCPLGFLDFPRFFHLRASSFLAPDGSVAGARKNRWPQGAFFHSRTRPRHRYLNSSVRVGRSYRGGEKHGHRAPRFGRSSG